MSSSDDTMYAPAERADSMSVARDAEALRRTGLVEHATSLIPSVLMILNKQRQVVYNNQRLMDLLGASSDQEVLGKRPGELFNCKHAYESVAGCGTTEFCRECGAVNAILKSQRDKVEVEKECRIITTDGDAYEFRVWASPFTFEGVDYIIFVAADIRDEKRRQVLEQTFFHDMNNILTVIFGHAQLLEFEKDSSELSGRVDAIQTACRQLVDEIDSQRNILKAENSDLAVDISPMNSYLLLEELVMTFSKCSNWKNRPVVIGKNAEEFEFTSDHTLLFRVLGNMLKNALEASSESDEVLITCTKDKDSGIFSVHNPNFIPRSVQLQLFQRSFSTKGKGRGIGTYSMKLFGERYLKGKVWFSTSEEGTVFSISIPLVYHKS